MYWIGGTVFSSAYEKIGVWTAPKTQSQQLSSLASSLKELVEKQGH